MPVATNTLRDVFAVLCGTHGPKYKLEPEMRLFQLKVWLLSDDSDLLSISDLRSFSPRSCYEIEFVDSIDVFLRPLLQRWSQQCSRAKVIEIYMILHSPTQELRIIFRSNFLSCTCARNLQSRKP